MQMISLIPLFLIIYENILVTIQEQYSRVALLHYYTLTPGIILFHPIAHAWQ